jgi:hypothetical protein
MTLDPDGPRDPSPWSSPGTRTEVPSPRPEPYPERREPFLGKPRWMVITIVVAIVLGALATALTVMAGGGPRSLPAPTFPPTDPTATTSAAGATTAAGTGEYRAPADLCQDADFTNLRPPFTTIGDMVTRGSTTPTLVVAGCDGTTGNDTVDGGFSFEVQVSSHPDALLDLFHQQRAALAARVAVTPVPGLGTEAFQYAAVGQHGLSLDIYDANLIMRLSWTADRPSDKLPDGLSQALVGTCRSTLRLLRQV